jgi:hypothetical protein
MEAGDKDLLLARVDKIESEVDGESYPEVHAKLAGLRESIQELGSTYANRVADVQKRNSEALANLQLLQARMERQQGGLQAEIERSMQREKESRALAEAALSKSSSTTTPSPPKPRKGKSNKSKRLAMAPLVSSAAVVGAVQRVAPPPPAGLSLEDMGMLLHAAQMDCGVPEVDGDSEAYSPGKSPGRSPGKSPGKLRLNLGMPFATPECWEPIAPLGSMLRPIAT